MHKGKENWQALPSPQGTQEHSYTTTPSFLHYSSTIHLTSMYLITLIAISY